MLPGTVLKNIRENRELVFFKTALKCKKRKMMTKDSDPGAKTFND